MRLQDWGIPICCIAYEQAWVVKAMNIEHTNILQAQNSGQVYPSLWVVMAINTGQARMLYSI